jgi:hypothetical protein
MKQIYTSLILITVTLFTLTGCDIDDDDRMEARTLEGTWTGYIDNYYYDRWGETGNSYRTAFYFERENAYGGWGYELDYDARNPRQHYWYCDFRWEIVHGDIRIQYYDRNYTDIVIYDYVLDDYHFSGSMDDGYSDTRTYFTLDYDRTFNWSYWGIYDVTRAATDSSYKAISSGSFAEKTSR